MNQETASTPYKSNYTIGIIFTVLTLLYLVSNALTIILPGLACIGGIASLASGILFLVWLYRSCKNLEAFNTQGAKYSPGLAVGSWFIPVVNFALPFLIIMQLWKASDPDASTVGWKQSKNGMVVILWWASFFIFLILSIVGMGAAFATGFEAGMSGIEPDMNAFAMSASIPSIIGMALYSILQISVVVLMNDRQDEKAENLGLLQ